jgi:hypothetical protein
VIWDHNILMTAGNGGLGLTRRNQGPEGRSGAQGLACGGAANGWITGQRRVKARSTAGDGGLAEAVKPLE